MLLFPVTVALSPSPSAGVCLTRGRGGVPPLWTVAGSGFSTSLYPQFVAFSTTRLLAAATRFDHGGEPRFRVAAAQTLQRLAPNAKVRPVVVAAA